jgi:hypothetical protein
MSSSPELITIEETPMGRATYHAIEQELQKSAVAVASAGTEIFEISTFVVTGDEIFGKASEASRRDFVERRLLHRLPVVSMKDVIRIDLSRSPAAQTVILRVWTKVAGVPG